MAQREKRCTRDSSKRSDKDVDEKGSIQQEVQSSPNKPPRALRNAPSAVLNSLQRFLFRIRLPFHRLHRMNIAEILVTISYLTALLIWSFINSRGLTVGLWANRVAHLATSQTPLIVALAGKNNIITLLTGIGYEKLNVLHRASARSTLVLIWVHAFGRWRLGLRGRFSLSEADMRFGVVSMVAFTLAVLLSIRPIRNIFYEAFLLSHIILVTMYLIFGLFHVPEAKHRFWPALAIWGLDRLLRALRVIILNKLWVNITPLGTKVDEASLERVSSDTVRLTVRRSLKWRSGQHAYINSPTIATLPFEAHPFTIASVYSKEAREHSRSQELVFIIRCRDGFTNRLLKASETRQSIPVAIDGPYGAPPCLSHYSTCVFLAGGGGVSYTLPLSFDLVRRSKTGNAVAQRARFVWVIREASHIEWISDLLLAAVRDCPPILQLSINIYVTRQCVPQLTPEDTTTDETSSEATKQPLADESKYSLLSFQAVKILGGRPDINLILEEELSWATGRVSIDVSGPSTLADATREALVTCSEAQPSVILRGAPRTTLHVEDPKDETAARLITTTLTTTSNNPLHTPQPCAPTPMMANDNEVTISKVPSDAANSLLLQPQPTSPFPSPSSSFVPPPAQEAHEFANKTTTRIAAAKQPRSATHSRRNSSEDKRISSSPLQESNSQPLAPDQPLPPPTPTLKRCSVESNNSLSSSRPAPASPALSRHSSLLHTGAAKRLSTLSIVSTSTPPPTIEPAKHRASIKIRDFAFSPTDERHFGRCLQNRDSVASSTGSDMFSNSRRSSEPSSPSDPDPDPSSGHASEDEDPFVPGIYRALYPFEPEGTAEMALVEDQRVNVLGRGGGIGWVVVLKPDGEQALVPEGYLELVRPDLDDDDDDDSVVATEAPQTPRALP